MTKVKNRFLSAVLFIFCSLIICLNFTASTFAETMQSPIVIEPLNTLNDTVHADAITSINQPTCIVYALRPTNGETMSNYCIWDDSHAYNTAVVFRWQAGSYIDNNQVKTGNLTLSPKGNIYYDVNNPYYEFSFPVINNDDKTSVGRETSNYTQISWIERNSDGSIIKESNTYKCRYKVVNKFNKLQYMGNVPNSFSGDDAKKFFKWAHNGNSKNAIKATLAYNDQITDVNINIPFIGYKNQDVSIGGANFTIRVGIDYVYLKAAGEVPSAPLYFAFGVDAKD